MNFEILEHTADIGIRAYGRTLQDLFANAALGLESIALEMGAVEARESVQLAVSGEDLESLLVNWLNEVVFYLDARHFAMSRFEFETLSPVGLSGTAWGEARDPERHPPRLVVKAATYHQLHISRQNEVYVAEVYLDI